MKQFKTISLCLVLLLILSGFVLLPPYLSNMQDQTKMNKINSEKMEVSSKSVQKQLSSAEKIQIMIRFGMQSGSVMMTEQKKPENTSIGEDQIQSVCMEELNKLQNMGAFFLPDSSSKAQYFSYSLQTYVDISRPSVYVIIWKVNLIYNHYSVELTMDDQTHTIFSFSFFQQSKVNFIESNNLIQIWAEYLGLDKTLFSLSVSNPDFVLARYQDKNQPFYVQCQSNVSGNYSTNSISFYTDMKSKQTFPIL